MNHKFDELTKSLAQSVTRRAALKKFGVGLAGMGLGCFALTSKGAATARRGHCGIRLVPYGAAYYTGACVDTRVCNSGTSVDCPAAGTLVSALAPPNLKTGCGFYTPVNTNMRCSFTI